MDKQKKSIVVFVKNLTSGGAEKQSVLLALSLAGDCDVHYVVFNGSKLHQKYIDLLQKDRRIRIKTFKGGHVSRFLEFVKYLKKEKIDCIFSYLTAANLYACIAGLIVKVKVFTGLRNAKLPFLKRVADCFLTNTLAHVSIVNCYSGKSEFVNRHFKANNIVVIPNCYMNCLPYNMKPNREVPVIITVGRFVAQKDYETAIKAVALLKQRGMKFCFKIVGYGELEDDVRKWLVEYDVADMTKIYINPDNILELELEADIYLSTSLFEGTSNSIMEGMDANLPVVCTNVGDNAYLVEDGLNGFLYNVGDAESIADGLSKLIADAELRNVMGKHSKYKLTKCFGEQIFRERYLDVLSNHN